MVLILTPLILKKYMNLCQTKCLSMETGDYFTDPDPGQRVSITLGQCSSNGKNYAIVCPNVTYL